MRVALACLTAVLVSACSLGPIGATSSSSPPPLPAAAGSIDECQPLTSLLCLDQALQVSVPIANSGVSLVYRSDRVPGRTTAPAADVTGQQLGGWTISIAHAYDPGSQLLLLGDGTRRHVGALQVASGKFSGKLAIASVDGKQVFVFDSSGRQQATLDAVSGALAFTFVHDSSGRLIAIGDRGGDVIGIRRDAKGALASITLPGGNGVTVVTDSAGFIGQLAQPDGRNDTFLYQRGGLMTSHAIGGGAATFFAYDARGLLTSLTQPGGATESLTRAATTGGYSIAIRSSSGRAATYSVTATGGGITRQIDDAAGTSQEIIDATTRQLTLADGTRVTLQLGPDPRFGMQAPVVVKQTTVSPLGRTSVLGEQRQASSAGDPLIGVKLSDAFTLDGKTFTTAYDPGSRTIANTDPAGVRTTSVLDASGSVLRATSAGVTSQYAYDGHGRITSVTVGSGANVRKGTVAYDDNTGQITVTDPAGSKTVITADADGRPSLFALPGSTDYSLLYDPAGHVVQLAAPGGAHVRTYSARGLLTSEWSPATSAGAPGTTLTYDDDGLISSVANGGPAAPMQRDPAGRLTSVQTAAGPLTATFKAGSSVPAVLNGPGGVVLTRQVDGEVVTGESWSGPILGQVTLTLDGQGRVTATSTGGAPVPTAYDGSGRLARSGDVAFTYDASSGLPKAATMGSLATTFTYDAYGQLVTAATGAAWTQAFKHDADGRITEVDETIGGTTLTHVYAYDAQARLTSESLNGATTTYMYDGDGNMVSGAGPQGTVTFRYDAADRLLQAGSTAFAYASDGTLASRHGPEGTTTYTYDERGVLTGVTTPDGHQVQYVTDALGRRLGTLVKGSLASGMLWAGQVPVAELDPGGSVIERFAYDSTGRLVEMVTRDGKSYRVLTDPNGSVRLVVDATGAVAQRIDYDAFGNVISDTSPGFQPFGFGGGVYDIFTGLVRIGHRDYDARARRWTAPDPSGLSGGQPNLYAYVGDNPVNFRDPSGRYGQPVVTTTGGFGVQFTGIIGQTGGTFGIGAQNTGGGWGIYVNSGSGVGADVGVSIIGNFGNVYSPSSDPTNDWSGPTDSAGASFGPVTGGYYQSPNLGNGNGSPTYQGFYGGTGVGVGASTVSTNTVCIAGCGSSHGDPHYVSGDGLAVDYQGAGEYLALTSSAGDMTVQVRQQPRASELQVAVNSAVAASVAGDKVGVYIFDPGLPARPSLFVNGQPNFNMGRIPLAHGGRLDVDPGMVVMTWPDGSYLVVHKQPVANVEYFLATARKGSVTGLWGAYTGDQTKDLVTRSGQVLTPPPNGIVDPSFGDSWRITQAESLFDDLPGQDVAHYTNRLFGIAPATPSALPPAARTRATSICTGAGLSGLSLSDCILDVGATGDPSFAAAEATAPVSHPQVPDVYDIAVGEPVSPTTPPGPGAGQLTRPKQTQVYRFYSDANRNIYVTTDTPCSGNVVLELFSPEHGGLIESIGCSSDIGRVPLLVAGQYSIEASVTGGGPATYAFTVHAGPPDQEFKVQPGVHVSADQPAPGAGNISLLGLRQLYTFSIGAPQVVYLEQGPNCNADMQYALVPRDLVNSTHGTISMCSDWGRVELTPGTWTVEVTGLHRATGTYAFALLAVPPDVVAQISIGASPTGHLDAHGARQQFEFTGTPGQVVHLAHTGGCGAQQQLEYRLTTPDSLDGDGGYLPLCDDFGALRLPPGGRYVIEVRALTDSGTFGFSLTP